MKLTFKQSTYCLTTAALAGVLGWSLVPGDPKAQPNSNELELRSLPRDVSGLADSSDPEDKLDLPVYPAGSLDELDDPMLSAEFGDQFEALSAPNSYAFEEENGGKSVIADNKQHQFGTRFDQSGVSISAPKTDGKNWNFSLGLRRGTTEPAPELTADLSQVEFDHGSVTEWYRHDSRGLQQGFVVNASMENGQAGEGITLEVDLGSGTNAVLGADGDHVVLTEEGVEDGTARTLYYSGLLAFDANGNRLPASMSLNGANTIALNVDDTAAAYPIWIDPFLSTTIVEGVLIPETPAGNPDPEASQFGWSVAVNGNTAVVGDRGNRPNGIACGAAYIYEREAPRYPWELVKKVYPTEATTYWYFGYSVAVSDDIIVIGSMYARTPYNSRQGGAYVYERNLGGPENWGLRKKLFASNGASGDEFGRSVTIDGDIIAVGAPSNDAAGNTAGSAYVFKRDFGGPNAWGQRRIIPRPSGSVSYRFGRSVSVDDGTLLVGSYSGTDRADVFLQNSGGNGNWGLVKTLNPVAATGYNRYFGYQVSLKGDVAIMGGGRRYDPSQGKWGGAAYIFERNAGGSEYWGQVQELMRPGPVTSEQTSFGKMVAAGEDKILISDPGSPYSPSATLLGRAHIYERNSSGAWLLTGTIQGTTKSFGYSNEKAVALDHDSDIALVGETGLGADGGVHPTVLDFGIAETEIYSPPGSPNWNPGAVDIGHAITVSGYSNVDRAYAYVRTENTLTKHDLWALIPSHYKPTNAGGIIGFGTAVATTGNIIYVGAPGYFNEVTDGLGVVFVFRVRPGGYLTYYGAYEGGEDDGIGAKIEVDNYSVVIAGWEHAYGDTNETVAFVAPHPLVAQPTIDLDTSNLQSIDDVAIWGVHVVVSGTDLISALNDPNNLQKRVNIHWGAGINPGVPIASRLEAFTQQGVAVAVHSERIAIVWRENLMHLIDAGSPHAIEPPLQVFTEASGLVFGDSVDLDEDNLVVGAFDSGAIGANWAAIYCWNNNTDLMDLHCVGVPSVGADSPNVAVYGDRTALNGAALGRTFIFECPCP